MLGKVLTVPRGVKYSQNHIGLSRVTLVKYRQSHSGYNYNTESRWVQYRVTLCIIIIQSHVGYNTGGVTLGTVQTESRCV